MKIGHIFSTASLTGAACLMLAATAHATTITYTTNATGTAFVSAGGGSISNGGLTLSNSGGAAATLTFNPNTTSGAGVPTNINLGDFLLVCALCGPSTTPGSGSSFSNFTFDLVISDTTDGATGEFVGTSAGGSVFSDQSTIDIVWSPLQVGPGTSGALSGNFLTTVFTITSPTGVVAPNSGTPLSGDTTVQGHVDSVSTTPEPATLSMIGGGLLGLGLLRRKGLLLQ